MIQINNRSTFNARRLERIVRNYNSGRYQFDSNALKNDIDRFRNMALNEGNSWDYGSYSRLADYLQNDILENLNRFSRLRLKWCVDDNGDIFTAPIRLMSYKKYELNIIDYVYKTDEHTVELDYKDLWDAMAFALAYKDLGIEHKRVESVLNRCNLMYVNDSSILSVLYDNKTFHDVQLMRIGESNFKLPEVGAVDYFGECIDTGMYKDLLVSSIRKMMACIINEELNGIDKMDFDVEFLGLFESTIYFNTNLDRKEIINQLHKSIAFKMFGRDFEFVPKIRIY